MNALIKFYAIWHGFDHQVSLHEQDRQSEWKVKLWLPVIRKKTDIYEKEIQNKT